MADIIQKMYNQKEHTVQTNQPLQGKFPTGNKRLARALLVPNTKVNRSQIRTRLYSRSESDDVAQIHTMISAFMLVTVQAM